MKRPLGIVLYNGPSMLDGAPIIVILNAFRPRNRKTGDMLQTWILRKDEDPTQAVQSGADASVCGDCPLRGEVIDGRNTGRACYVNIGQAPWSVWTAYHAGSYSEWSDDHSQYLAGRRVRLGSYGDPAAVPYSVWRDLLALTAGHTGYTHQWRTGRFWRLRRYVMASTETTSDTRAAKSKKWRVFQVGSSRPKGLTLCPASKEAGEKTTCDKCGACDGNESSRRSVFIQAHGSPSVISNFRKSQA